MHAYAASRQWVNQARLWVSEVDSAVWEQAKQISLTDRQAVRLKSDLNAAYRISQWVKWGSDNGHWKGKGSGDRALFVAFSANWIANSPDSDFVEDFKERYWHQLLSGGLRGSLDLAANEPPPAPTPRVEPFPFNKRAVFLKSDSVEDLDDIDGLGRGEADFYAKVVINKQTFIESVQNGHDTLNPPWITMKFVDAGISAVAIRYEVWDEDYPVSDDHLDIEPRDGISDLDFLYNMATHRSGGIGIDGVFDNPSSLLVSRGDGDNRAEVKMFITTRTLAPAPRSDLLAPVVSPNEIAGAVADH